MQQHIKDRIDEEHYVSNEKPKFERSELIRLVAQLEQDDSVECRDFLTDGPEEEYHPRVKQILDWIYANGFEGGDIKILKSLGYEIIRGDCICFSTKKGIINTGTDSF